MSLAVAFQGFGVAALVLVPFDLAPNFSGPLNAVVHTCYAIAALLAPLVVGLLTPHVIKFYILRMNLANEFMQTFSFTRNRVICRNGVLFGGLHLWHL